MLHTPRWTVLRGGRPISGMAVLGTAVVALLVSGCHREEIASYEVPKETPPAPAAMPPGHGSMGGAGGAGGMGMGGGMPARPGMRWKELPEGWTSLGASGMRAGSFQIAGDGDGQAELGVIPLPGTGGTDLDLVNLWRGQLGLPAIAEDALPSHTEETEVAGQAVKLFKIVGTGSADAAAAGNQILVAALRRDGFTWFFKLGGDLATVDANREPLKRFLAGVEFTAPEAAPAMAVGSGSGAGMPGGGVAPVSGGGAGSMPKPKWQVPGDWKAQAVPQMVHSKWTVSAGETAATADVTVSVFPGETGGLVANLNRWRSQVGLSPAPDAELNALQDNLDVLGGKATLADFEGSSPESGDPARIVAVVVRRDGYSWFYKLLGSPAAVAAHREAFVQFIQTAQYLRGS